MVTLNMDKKQFLDNMRNFIERESVWLQNLTQYLGLNFDDLPEIIKLNPVKLVSCPINNDHRIPEDSLDIHVAKCSSKYEDYPTFTGEEDRTIDTSNKSIIAELPSSEIPHDSSSNTQTSSSKCLIELLSAERDAKRRRAAYRKKRVHTNKKSYNEILKELIENEMKTLEGTLKSEMFQESDLNLTNNNAVERVEKNAVYSGVGKWLYQGNPYKRWMTITDEEKEFFKSDCDDEKTKHSSHSLKKARYSTNESDINRHRLKHNSNVDERSRFFRDDDRYFQKHERYRSRSRVSYSYSKELSHRKHKSRNSPFNKDNNNVLSKISKDSKTHHSKSKTPIDSRNCSAESRESVAKCSYDATHPDEVQTKTAEKKSKFKSKHKSVDRYRSSSHSDTERKRHKKKKSKKKHEKKKKRHRNSTENSS